MRERNNLLVSSFFSGAVITKYSLRKKTGKIEGVSGNEKTFTHFLTVPSLES